MSLQRFDVMIEGHYPSAHDRDYCDDGSFVDAEIAKALYEALDEVKVLIPYSYAETEAKVKAALAKARGES